MSKNNINNDDDPNNSNKCGTNAKAVAVIGLKNLQKHANLG